MKVKPWATVEETLDAFYNALLENRRSEAFWQGLKSLLAILSGDLQQRVNARHGEVVDNELLDLRRQQQLLDEIRRALTGQQRGRGGFRKLTSALSPPAIGLLAMLGGIASQGCYLTDATSDDADTKVSRVEDAQAKDARAEADQKIRDSGVEDARTEADQAIRDSGVDAGVKPPDTGVNALETCETKALTISEIVNCCLPSGYGYEAEVRKQALTCINGLNAAWRTGLEELFQSENCDMIISQLKDCLLSECAGVDCSNPQDAGEFDRDAFLENCCYPIYIGVRFE